MKQPKCSVCRRPITPDCDFNQGRCPHRPIKVDDKKISVIIMCLLAPFIILKFIVTHPRLIWRQAKKDWSKNERTLGRN